VLLSAWIQESTETIMAASEHVQEAEDPTADGLGIASKGYQQITSWQVRHTCKLPCISFRPRHFACQKAVWVMSGRPH